MSTGFPMSADFPNGITRPAAKFKIQWTHGLSEKLCKLYKTEESLYNVNHEDYHNRDARCAAWARITSVLGVSSNASKKRIDSMRTQYVRFLRDQTGRAGKPWFADRIQFLKVFIKGRAGEINNHQKDEGADKSVNEDSNETPQNIKFECSNDTGLEAFDDNDSAEGEDGDDEEMGEEEESTNNTTVVSAKNTVQGISYSRGTKRSHQKIESNNSSSRSVGNSSRINSSTDVDGFSRAELIHSVAGKSAARYFDSSRASMEDVHETFGRYIASELREHRGSAKILAACKREIFMAISRMHEAENDN